ncbi:hypothetical protein FRB96_001862 [Tulasnella sp. 330]|nr:hypothetical protein FRB96_001862 [Tulasnella sp. 330]KAG8885143.1 hypothetical protein FRB97_001961 [Tulasnella sp. 331]KAG8890032.1 hypothetical protein FRB98_001467 [Tulasnella sp. 332]
MSRLEKGHVDVDFSKMKGIGSLSSLHLYTSPLSGCSARIRTTLAFKASFINQLKVSVTEHSIPFTSEELQSTTYLAKNPNGSVPCLVAKFRHPETKAGQENEVIITQSPAIFDFIEQTFPTPPLIPSICAPRERTLALSLASLVACDIQPPQNSRIRAKIAHDFGGDSAAWARDVYQRGFSVYETLIVRARKEGQEVEDSLPNENKAEARFSVGHSITVADIFLVPAAQGALRMGVKLESWPVLKAVVDECWKEKAFRDNGLGGHGRLVH